MSLAATIKPGDWESVRRAIHKLAYLELGPTAAPTFAGLTISGTATVGTLTDGVLSINAGSITSAVTAVFSGVITCGGLTTDFTDVISEEMVIVSNSAGGFQLHADASGDLDLDFLNALDQSLKKADNVTFAQITGTADVITSAQFLAPQGATPGHSFTGAPTYGMAFVSSAVRFYADGNPQFKLTIAGNGGIDLLTRDIVGVGNLTMAGEITMTDLTSKINYGGGSINPLEFAGTGTFAGFKFSSSQFANVLAAILTTDTSTFVTPNKLEFASTLATGKAIFFDAGAGNIRFDADAVGKQILFDTPTLKLYATTATLIGGTTNYSKFEADGTLEFNGTATVFKDINLGSALLTKPAASAPDTDEFKDEGGNDTGIETYAFAVGEKVSGNFELQHDYKEGSDITFHVHFQGIAVPTGTDKVKWQLIYTITREGATLDATTTIVKEIDFDTQYEFLRADFVAITGTNFLMEDQFLFQLSRVAASADEYGGDALIATVGLHYEIDTVGSRTITTK